MIYYETVIIWERSIMGKDLKGRELGKGIIQKKNGAYEARYIDAYGVRKSIYSRDLSKIKGELRDKLYERDHHIQVKKEGMTLDEWFDEWMTVYKKNTIKKSSILNYNTVYNNYIRDELGRLPLISITKLRIQKLINKMYDEGYSWAVQDKVKRLLNDMYGRAIEDEFAIRNPTKGLRLMGEKGSYRVLSKEEQEMFFETAAGTFYENLFIVAVNTGLRPAELFALTEEDLDFSNKVIHVRRNLLYHKYEEDDQKTFHWDTPKTKCSTRDVPINSLCEKYLKRQLMMKRRLRLSFPNDTDFSEVIFVTTHNTPINSSIYHDAINRIVQLRNELLDDCEKMEKFGGHTFRHTFATRCIEAGVKPKTLQEYMGHATIQMTMNLYVHTMEETKQEEMLLLEKNTSNLYRFNIV